CSLQRLCADRVRLMFAILGSSFRERFLTPGQVVYLLLSWAVAGTVPEEYRRVAYLFDDHHEGIGPGWFAEEELQKEMASFFEQFRTYERLFRASPQTGSSAGGLKSGMAQSQLGPPASAGPQAEDIPAAPSAGLFPLTPALSLGALGERGNPPHRTVQFRHFG